MPRDAPYATMAAPAATLVWLWLVEGTRPDRWDLIGVSVCLVGAAIILFAPHRAPG